MNHNHQIVALLLAISFAMQPLLFALHMAEHDHICMKRVTDYPVVEQLVSGCELCDVYQHLSFFSLTFFSLTFPKPFATYVVSFRQSIQQEFSVNHWLRGPPVAL
ncbi:MAG: hypothetical protein AAF632_14850 [Bacteroidota bacterium]